MLTVPERTSPKVEKPDSLTGWKRFNHLLPKFDRRYPCIHTFHGSSPVLTHLREGGRWNWSHRGLISCQDDKTSYEKREEKKEKERNMERNVLSLVTQTVCPPSREIIHWKGKSRELLLIYVVSQKYTNDRDMRVTRVFRQLRLIAIFAFENITEKLNLKLFAPVIAVPFFVIAFIALIRDKASSLVLISLRWNNYV